MSCDARAKGFVHLNSFDTLRAWVRDGVDPLEQSNTPLFRRVETNAARDGQSRVMLIHDYEGSYLDYEACQGAAVVKEKYSCEYLQYVDTFVYFSHQLVTVPPPTWTNTCHRAGVKVLGTFIVEPGTPQVEQILEQHDGEFWVARQLASMADAYGFDGWLINIERPFPILYWSNSKLEAFLRQLRLYMGPDRKVVWYDALTMLNVTWYQNTLNYLNLPFALAAGAILTNYAWTPALAKQARDIAERSGLGADNVYFGIDAWAQNTQHGKNTRSTYPPKTGGGTGIGMGVREVARFGLNVGIFAPGWSFEHFQHHNVETERGIWLGDEITARLLCDCSPAGLHLDVPYREHPVSKYARSYPAGSNLFLHTDFRRACERQAESGHDPKLYAHLGCQSILPTTGKVDFEYVDSDSTGAAIAELDNIVRDAPSRCSFSVRVHDTSLGCAQRKMRARLRVFDVSISDTEPIELSLTYDKSDTTDVDLKLILNGSDHIKFPVKPRGSARITTSLPETDRRSIQYVDMVVEATIERLAKLEDDFISLLSLTIRPRQISKPTVEICDLHIEDRGSSGSDQAHHRLVWRFSATPDTAPRGMPYSNTTGPFAYFQIYTNDVFAGVAFALEFELAPDTIVTVKPLQHVAIAVIGIGFDGSTIASTHELLNWPSEDGEGWMFV